MMAIPETMKAWKKTKPESGGFQLIDSTVPNPQPNEVLVKTHSTSIYVVLTYIFGSGMTGQLITSHWGRLQAMRRVV